MGLFSTVKHDILAFIARCNGNGVIAEDFEARDVAVERVNAISIQGPWRVEILPPTGANRGRIVIERRFLDRVDFRYGNETVNLSMLEVIGFWPKVMPRLELYLNELPESLVLMDNSEIKISSPMTGDFLQLEARGQAQVDLGDIQLKNLNLNLALHSECRCGGKINCVKAKITHQGKCEFSGWAEDLSAEMSGRSVFNVTQAENSAFNLADAAEASIISTQKMAVSARGCAKISYCGMPEITRNISEYAQVIPR